MKLLCFGDSNTYGYDPRSYLGDRYPANIRWVNRLAANTDWTIINGGQNGRMIPSSANGLPPADCCIIMLGTNDLLQGYTAEETSRRMEIFLQSAKPMFRKILLIAPPHMKYGIWVTEEDLITESMHLSSLYQELTQKMDICFADASQWNIDLTYDGVHFSEKGHLRFYEKIKTVLELF